MEIQVRFPSADIAVDDDQIYTISNPNLIEDYSRALEKLVILILGGGKRKTVKGYKWSLETDTQTCLITFDIHTEQEPLVPIKLWDVLREKIGLIKENIIDPIQSGKDANAHWQQNIGMSFCQINALKSVVKPLNRLLSTKKVFRASANDNFGKIQSNILDKLPAQESSLIVEMELNDVEVSYTNHKKHEVTFELIKPIQSQQKTYRVKMTPKTFSEFINETKYQQLFNITINGRKKITGKIIECEYVRHVLSDLRIIVDQKGLSKVVNKNQLTLFVQDQFNSSWN